MKRESGLNGVILKATEGSGTYQDPEFQTNKAECIANGLDWGVYFYTHLVWNGKPGNPEGHAQAVVNALGGDMPPLGIWMDLETKEVDELFQLIGAEATADWIQRCTDELKRLTGVDCGLYWSRRAVTECLGEHADRFKHLPMWWAYYPSPPSELDRWKDSDGVVWPAGHNQLPDYKTWPWHFWQYSSTGLVPGIKGGKGNVDSCVFNGDDAAFAAFKARFKDGSCDCPCHDD